MKAVKICIHWTSGNYRPNMDDLDAYHFLFDNAGKLYHGDFKPEANFRNLKLATDEQYAKHCGGGNSWAIGVALCGMTKKGANGNWVNPITHIQAEAMFSFLAKLCIKYGIEVTPETVYTHYEFGLKNPKTSSKGKIDITALPYRPDVPAKQVGNFIRNKVRWHIQHQKRVAEHG